MLALLFSATTAAGVHADDEVLLEEKSKVGPVIEPGEPTVNQIISAVVEDIEGLKARPGFGQFVIRDAAKTLEILWKGQVPDDVRAEAAEAGASRGVIVDFVPVKMSLAESLAGMEAIGTRERQLGVDVHDIYPTDDYSGLVAMVEPADYERAGKSAELAPSFTSAADVPVEVRPGGGSVPLSRSNDVSPWVAGGWIQVAQGGCTSGFSAVKNGGGGDRLLTAGHCDPSGNGVIRDGAGDVISSGGALVGYKPAFDSLGVIPNSSDTAGLSYGGPWDNTSGGSRYLLDVVGSSAPAVGQNVCGSGANLGERCPLVIGTVDFKFDCPVSGLDCYGIRLRAASGSPAIAAQGDSGGPVYWPNGSGQMKARGIITAGAVGYDVPCPADMRVPNGVLCFSRYNAVDTERLEAAWDYTIQ